MNLDLPKTPAEAIDRFRMLIRQRIPYQLEGTPTWDPHKLPEARTPGNCSVAACWALGVAIHQPLDRWLNSPGIVADALEPGGLFAARPNAAPGCLVVYPWKDGRPGHVGMVTAVENGEPKLVLHCSPRNGREDSVRETDADVFLIRRDRVYAWFTGFAQAAAAPALPPLLIVNHGILTTEFGGGDESGMESAYGGRVNPAEPQASLPARVAAARRRIIVENPENGLRVRCLVNDVGPWNTADAYFEDGSRPLAELQFAKKLRAQNKRVPVNAAGLDLTTAALDALGVPGNKNTRSARVNWWFE